MNTRVFFFGTPFDLEWTHDPLHGVVLEAVYCQDNLLPFLSQSKQAQLRLRLIEKLEKGEGGEKLS